MDIKTLKTQGIYFRQSDARKEGYYTEDNKGNLRKNEYKITLKDKFKYLITDKKPSEPISTTYIYFIIYNNEFIVKSGNMSGDAVSVAREVRRSSGSDKKFPVTISGSTLIIDYGRATEELEFDENGNNILCKIINHKTFEVKKIKSYAFLNWYEV